MGTLAALFDELEKIASETGSPKKEKFKKWLKSSLAVAAGAGLGTGAYMVGERAISQKLGPAWRRMNPNTRRAIAGGTAGLATMGGLALAQRLEKEKKKHNE